MDELKKIPPVTRFILAGSLAVTVPVILKILDPSPLVMYWPFVRYRYQIWRPVTSFFLAGGGIQLIFDIIAIFRSSSALEEGEPFYRSTSSYTWTLLLTNALILLLNHPLGSALHFRPMLYAITTFWSRAYRNESVNIFGVVNVRAPLLPYAYLVLELLMGGPHPMMQAATGILAAYAIHYIRDEIPRPPPGARLRPQDSLLKRVVGAVQKFVCEPPLALQRALPDSVDPVAGGTPARAAAGSGASTGEGRAVRSTPFGTAFAPRGRAFGSAPTTAPSPSAAGSSASASASSGWLGGLFGSGASSGSSGRAGSHANDSDSTRRQAMLDAIERRARAAREDSIAGRAQAAAASAPAGSASLSGTSQTSALAATSTNAAVRRTAATAGQGGSGSNIHSLQFGSATNNKDKDKGKGKEPNGDEPELDASGSGGRVAEQRRATSKPDEGDEKEKGAAAQAWGGGGGRRLDE
ncbi:hypothetical protein OC835_006582 [Tilletia horrida]|nr:hypothetical protein OC835_006582 [Tilletia horrida]